MTPAELITTKLKQAIETNGATVGVDSLLLEALEGKPRSTPSSGIVLSVNVSGQINEPLPIYTFSCRATLAVSVDDDKRGELFRDNYDVLWATFHTLAQGDACAALGDELDTVETHVFAVDGFQITEGDAPDFQTDNNGGVWSISLAATITGRAN